MNNFKKFTIIFSAHPRTLNRLKNYNLLNSLSNKKGLLISQPIGYLDFLKLLHNSKIVLTDSGGIQEEACILRIPCVTLRDNTERPETLKVNSNLLVGTEPNNILEGVKSMLIRKTDWENPFGDGKTAKKIIDIIYNEINYNMTNED